MPLPARAELVASLAHAKSTQNIDAVMELVTDDIEMAAPTLYSTERGKPAVREQLERFYKLFPDYAFTPDESSEEEGMVRAWGTTHMTIAGPALGVETNGRRASAFAYIEVEFRDHQISRELFALDLRGICRGSGLAYEKLRDRLRR